VTEKCACPFRFHLHPKKVPLAVVEGKLLGIEVGDQEPCHQSAQAQIIGYVGSNATGRIFEWLGHDIMSRVTPLM
jgi:hypothetical protein